MKYYIEAQYLPKGAVRPLDQGATINVEAGPDGFAIVPAVGDYVNVSIGAGETQGRAEFSGKVVTRLFRYVHASCLINIVVAEDDVDWGRLVKE